MGGITNKEKVVGMMEEIKYEDSYFLLIHPTTLLLIGIIVAIIFGDSVYRIRRNRQES